MSEGSLRVGALGGGGAMGRFAVRAAADFPFVERLVGADPDEGKAHRPADRIGLETIVLPAHSEDRDGLASQASEPAPVPPGAPRPWQPVRLSPSGPLVEGRFSGLIASLRRPAGRDALRAIGGRNQATVPAEGSPGPAASFKERFG